MIIQITQVATPPAPSFAGALTATGTTQATAYQLTAAANVVTVVAAGSGVMLPPSGPARVLNRSANSLLVYPAVGQAIENNGLNAPVLIAPDGAARFDFDGVSTWWVS